MLILKGGEVSLKIKEQVQTELKKLKGYIPRLAIVRVGERPDDIAYERGAIKKMESFGLRAEAYVFPQSIADAAFKAAFQAINMDSDVDGILLLRPLPEQICEEDIARMIDPSKDVDGMSPINIAKLFSGDGTGFVPCTPEAVIEVFHNNHIPISGKRVTIVGRSKVVGKPLSLLLLKEEATVTICHTKTQNLEEVCKNAEILIAAAGRIDLLNQNHVAQDAVVIDIGINVNAEGKLCGDVNHSSIEGIASMITPVPGGVGTVTTAVLASHLVKAALLHREKTNR